MATYTIPRATPEWQTLPAPSVDAWLQPIGGAIYISQDATPDKATAGIVASMTPYPVASGQVWKVASVGSGSPSLRMWDR